MASIVAIKLLMDFLIITVVLSRVIYRIFQNATWLQIDVYQNIDVLKKSGLFINRSPLNKDQVRD